MCCPTHKSGALNYQYSLNGVYLKEVTSQKDLGITISNSLNQTKHVQELVKKARQKIAMFRRCFTGLDEAKVTTLYQSIVRPALEFASTALESLHKERYWGIREGADKMLTSMQRQNPNWNPTGEKDGYWSCGHIQVPKRSLQNQTRHLFLHPFKRFKRAFT